jgi:hypothetical protein
MINKLIKFANHLDSKGLHKEANYLDSIIKKKAMAIPPDLAATVIGLMMPIATPMISAMVDECMDDISKTVMKECVSMFGGVDDDCVKEKSAEIIEQKMTDPAVVQKVLSAGLSQLKVPMSIPTTSPLSTASGAADALASGSDLMGNLV